MNRLSNIFLLLIYTALVFSFGALLGWGGGGVIDSRLARTPRNLNAEFAPFWEVWNIAHREYFEQPLDDTVLVEGAIKGMLATLGDPNTRYLDPVAQDQEEQEMEGEFEGIGVTIETVEDVGVVVVAPIEGSPAQEAGIKAGDVLLAADGVPLPDADTAVELVRGPAGEPVTLTIGRNETEIEIIVTRGVIEMASVIGRTLDNNIAYIQITQFANDTAESFSAELETLLAQNPSGLILDLRNNPGGLLSSVVSISDELLDEGIILNQQFGNGSKTIFDSDSGDIGETIPLVVLINEGSASASEVLAGAITARERGTIIGTQSFGKGTVQSVQTLSNGGGLRVTIAHWLTPDDEWIHEVGVTPDIIIEPIEGDEDIQLDRAIEILIK
ncbi:MAG: S41 family peptidase [Candidatus Promineifilaceae bacterium]